MALSPITLQAKAAVGVVAARYGPHCQDHGGARKAPVPFYVYTPHPHILGFYTARQVPHAPIYFVSQGVVLGVAAHV